MKKPIPEDENEKIKDILENMKQPPFAIKDYFHKLIEFKLNVFRRRYNLGKQEAGHFAACDRLSQRLKSLEVMGERSESFT